MALKEKILEVMGGVHVGAVATVDQGRPAVRFMALRGQDDLTLVGATMKGSRKVQQISKSPDVAISIWSCGEYTDPYVVIRATGEVHEDRATRQKFWNEQWAQYFQSVDNPEFVVLTFVPTTIEYTDPTAGTMEVWEREAMVAAR
ncbi:MAG: pyridoxamine 5'-phosphate oxidase family protein [Methanomicrobiaceae archaeon]|nr:pyridoxamine 5'-phosphate oxidase family protein [Methanomicrobiaceae archaeon]